MPFDEEAVSAASNEEPVSRFARLKTVRWGRVFLWLAIIVTALAVFSSGPGALALIPFLAVAWFFTWLITLWLRRDTDLSMTVAEPGPEPAKPKRLDKEVALTLDEEIAFTALVSGLNTEPEDSKFDVVVYKDLLRMPWSKKPGKRT